MSDLKSTEARNRIVLLEPLKAPQEGFVYDTGSVIGVTKKKMADLVKAKKAKRTTKKEHVIWKEKPNYAEAAK